MATVKGREGGRREKDHLSADNDHGSGGNDGCRQDKGGNEDDDQRQTTAEKRRDEHRRGV
jgi:hypothetical protein